MLDVRYIRKGENVADDFKPPRWTTRRASRFELICQPGQAKGTCYPTRYYEGEEVHLPLRGNDHLIYVQSGKLDVQERNVNRRFVLAEGDTLWLRRPSDEEFLDVKTVALAPAQIVWAVIHL